MAPYLQSIIWSLAFRMADCVQCNMQASTNINGACFWMIHSQQTQSDAKDICAQRGGYLALITNALFLDQVHNFVISRNLEWDLKYVGYTVDSSTSNYAMYRFDGNRQSFAPFFSTSPYSGPYNCVALLSNKLHASRCDSHHYAICSDIENSNSSNAPGGSGYSESTILSQADTCDCTDYEEVTTLIHPVNVSEETLADLKKMTDSLRLEKKTLSSAIRRKMSAPDDRPSAAGFGTVGVLVIVIVFGGIALADLIPAFKHLWFTMTLKSEPDCQTEEKKLAIAYNEFDNIFCDNNEQ